MRTYQVYSVDEETFNSSREGEDYKGERIVRKVIDTYPPKVKFILLTEYINRVFP